MLAAPAGIPPLHNGRHSSPATGTAQLRSANDLRMNARRTTNGTGRAADLPTSRTCISFVGSTTAKRTCTTRRRAPLDWYGAADVDEDARFSSTGADMAVIVGLVVGLAAAYW